MSDSLFCAGLFPSGFVGNHLNRLLNPGGSRLGSLRFANPLQILAAMSRGAVRKKTGQPRLLQGI